MEVAARTPAAAHVVHGRGFDPAALFGERAPLGEDTASRVLAGSGQETGDRIEAAMVLALAGLRYAPEQADRVRVARLLEDLPGRALLHQLAGVHHAKPVTHLGDHREVVADEQYGGVELPPPPRPQLPSLPPHGAPQ